MNIQKTINVLKRIASINGKVVVLGQEREHEENLT